MILINDRVGDGTAVSYRSRSRRPAENAHRDLMGDLNEAARAREQASTTTPGPIASPAFARTPHSTGRGSK